MSLFNSCRKQYVVCVDWNDDAVLTEDVHFASPSSNRGIAVFRELLEKEAVEAVNRLANYNDIQKEKQRVNAFSSAS